MKLLFILLSFNLFADLLPNGQLKDLDKKKVDLIDVVGGEAAVINFWFLACEPCKKEMKYLSQFNSKYSKYGFKVVSINTDNARTLNKVKPFVKSQDYSFPVLLDPKSLYFRKIGAKLCPYLLVVNNKGEIVNRHSGYNPGDEIKLEHEIVSLIYSEISSDTSLTDSSIIKILEKVEPLDSKID
jgi:thiol-disulfide isomerase/thioredoxin